MNVKIFKIQIYVHAIFFKFKYHEEVIKTEEDIKREVLLVGQLFKDLICKYNKLETKKRLYKDIKDLTVNDIKTIIAIGMEMKNMSEVASDLDVTSGTSTITVDRLITKGYVERIRDLEDRRQVFVKLSAEGVKVYQSIEDVKNRVIERIFGVLTEDERQTLIKIIEKLSNEFNELFLAGIM